MLSRDEAVRYSRQLILPEISVKGQLAIKNSSAIVIGAGGLGCPVALYLAGAGLGRIAIVDHDTVELSNLHRQVVHPECNIGIQKALSLANQLQALNSNIRVDPICELITAENAVSIISPYDIIIDASDNMATRYLLNDVAVSLDKPLISGSALKWEGHLTVYHYGNEGPCYRCIFPKPPKPEAVTNCNDGGILGPITGMIGSLQALEAINIIIGKPNYSGKMLLFNALSGSMKTIKLRSKRKDCDACAISSQIKQNGILKDYKLFCGSGPSDGPRSLSLLQPTDRIHPKDFYQNFKDAKSHFLLDVRSSLHYSITKLENTTNLPYSEINEENLEKLCLKKDMPILCICRRGNESQRAVIKLRELGYTNVKDIIGGITLMANFDTSLAPY